MSGAVSRAPAVPDTAFVGDPASRLTPLDRGLIARLQRDGRMPLSALSAELGVSEATVQRRMQQLMDEGYFTVVGVVDPLRFGSGTAVIMGLNTAPHTIDTVGPALALIPEVRFVATVTGAFDVICEIITFNRSQLTDVLMRRVTRIEGIQGMNSSWVIRNQKTSFRWEELGVDIAPRAVGTAETIEEGTERLTLADIAFDALDHGIISLLQGQGRLSYADLASQLDTTESTARRRTLRLLRSRYLQVVAIGNPLRLGFREVVFLWLKVELARATAVLTALAGHPQIRYLSRVAGGVDIVAEGLFSDQAALVAYIDGPLAAVDGIREAAFSFELTIHKRAYVRFDHTQA